MQALVLATVCLAFFMATLDTTILNIAGPDLQQRLGASLDQALWVVNSYTLTFAVLLMTFGRLGDRYGHRTVFLAGLVCFNRSKIRFTVCRCLRGASRSARRISSITGLNRSSFDDRGGGLFGGCGQAEASALTTVRRPTLYLRSRARPDIPARASRRIAA
jgi:MFS family permease